MIPVSGPVGFASVIHCLCADRRHRIQRALGAIDDRVVDELAVELDRRAACLFGLGKGGDHPLGEIDLGIGRGEDAVDHADLVGVDAHLALKAERQRLAGRRFKAFLVLEIDPHGVERRLDARGAAGDDDAGAGIGKLALGAVPDHVDVEREVAGAKGAMLDARTGAQDRVDVAQPLSGLDDRDEVDAAHRQAALAFEIGQQPIDGLQGRGAFDLGEDDAVQPGLDDGAEITVAECGVGGIDPHVKQAGARLRVGGDDRAARRRFLGDRDRVLEIEDHRIGFKGQRLLDPTRVVAGREEERAERQNVSPLIIPSPACGRGCRA
jgi:hypothetical protein